MKLITFSYEGISRIGAIQQEEVVDLHAAYKALLKSEGKIRAREIAEAFVPADMTGFLQGGKESLELAKKAIDFALVSREDAGYKLVYALNEVKVEAPVPEPSKIICVGHNYREHILEMGREIPSTRLYSLNLRIRLSGLRMIFHFIQFQNSLIMKRNLHLLSENRHEMYPRGCSRLCSRLYDCQ